MKNLVALFIGCCLIFSVNLHAQDKLTKEKIIGSWSLAALEMKDAFYYDIEKDSLSLGSEVLSQLGDNSAQLEMAKTMMKSQFAMMKSMFFTFEADGKAVFNVSGEAKDGTYSVDEEKSTITTADKNNPAEKETLPGRFQDGKLKLTFTQPNGELVMTMKKK